MKRRSIHIHVDDAAPQKSLSLWSYNERTGYWDHERNVTEETAQQWLRQFQGDEPQKSFKVSLHRPNNKPVKVATL